MAKKSKEDCLAILRDKTFLAQQNFPFNFSTFPHSGILQWSLIMLWVTKKLTAELQSDNTSSNKSSKLILSMTYIYFYG